MHRKLLLLPSAIGVTLLSELWKVGDEAAVEARAKTQDVEGDFQRRRPCATPSHTQDLGTSFARHVLGCSPNEIGGLNSPRPFGDPKVISDISERCPS